MSASHSVAFTSVPLVAPRVTSVPIGATIADVVRMFRIPARFWTEGKVTVGGHEIGRDKWEHVKAKAGTVVNLHLAPAGGGGEDGNKNVLAIIASVLLIAVTAGIGAGILGPGGILGATGLGASFAAGTIGAQALAAVVGIGGQLLLNALFPPPVPKNTDGDKPINRADIQDNLLAKGQTIPRAVGTFKISPPLVCQPFSYLIGDDEYAEAVFALAGPHSFTDPRVKGVPLDDVEDVTVTFDQGLPTETRVNTFNRFAHTVAVSTVLTRFRLRGTESGYDDHELVDQADPEKSLPQWHRSKTRKAPDRAICKFLMSGLVINQGDPDNDTIVSLRFRIRKAGEGTWKRGPQIIYCARGAQTGRRQVVLHFYKPGADTAVGAKDRNGVYAVISGVASNIVIDQVRSASGVTKWATDVGTYRGIRTREGCEIYLDDSYFNDSDAVYEIEWMRSAMAMRGAFATAAGANAGERSPVEAQTMFETPEETAILGTVDMFDAIDDGGKWVAPEENDADNDTITWETMSSVWDENPVPDDAPIATISVLVKNTDFSQFSVLASGLVPTWDGTDWTGLSVSSNPADQYRYLLTGPQSMVPIDNGYVDDAASILPWRQECIDQGYEVNAILEGSLDDALNLVAASGFARPNEALKFGVIWHRDRSEDTPTQMFTPLNTADLSWSVAYSRRPTAIRAEYNNRDSDYEADELVIEDPDPVPGGADGGIDAVQYPGLVTAAQVTARALFDFDQVRKAVRYSFRIGIENIVTRRGELALLAHDEITRQVGFARVERWVNSNTFILDQPVPFLGADGLFAIDQLFEEEFIFRAGDPCIVVTRSEGETISHTIVAYNASTRAVTVEDATRVGEGDIAIFGPSQTIIKRVLITEIESLGDMEARITCMDE